MKNNRNSNSVLALASALTFVALGYSFDFWFKTASEATALNVDAREVWDMACFKSNKHHTSTEPDPTPTTPAPAMPAPEVKKPNVVKLATLSYARRLNSLGISNERVYTKVA